MSRAIVTSWGAMSLLGLEMSALAAPRNNTAAFFARDTGAITELQGTVCEGCTGNLYMSQGGGLVATDAAGPNGQGGSPVWDFSRQTVVPATAIPAGQRPRGMLTMDDEWVLAVQSVRLHRLAWWGPHPCVGCVSVGAGCTAC